MLKGLLIRVLALYPLWASQMSTQTIAILDLGEALITQGFNKSNILLKIWLDLMTISTKSEVIRMLVFSKK